MVAKGNLCTDIATKPKPTLKFDDIPIDVRPCIQKLQWDTAQVLEITASVGSFRRPRN